jgi:DNA-binding MarR family transcriptional regulator
MGNGAGSSKGKNKRPPDAVDAILAQWARERPDLDCSPMGPIGRIKRCAALLQRKLDETFEKFGLSFWEFDVLATLRRSGAPYCLAPTALFSTLMITSGTMTHRLKGLETRELVRRLPNPEDARSVLVQLTPAGLELIDRAVAAHVENERRILSALGADDLAMLDSRLSQLLNVLESG